MRALAVAVVVMSAFARVAVAAGGDVCLKTDGVPDGYYYGLSGSGVDRYITEYDVVRDTCFDPGAIICGARVRELYRGAAPAPVLLFELRCEDPANPGYPELAAPGLIAVADAGSLGPCSTSSSAPRLFTVGAGGGLPLAGVACPTNRIYACAIEPVHGAGPSDFCGVLLDTDSPATGASKYYSGGSFGPLGWNHFVELVVFRPKEIDLRMRASGSVRFPGDSGSKAVYTTRPNAGPTVTDDNVTLTLAMDNALAMPVFRTLDVMADQSVVSPALSPKPWGPFMTVVGAGGPTPPLVFLPPGRTVLRLETAGAATMLKLAAVINKRPVNLPLDVYLDDPVVDVLPTVLEGAVAVDSERDVVGLRRRAGSPDDNSAEGYSVAQSPSVPGDAFNVRMRRYDLPQTAAFVVSGVEIVGGEFGGLGLPGLDAVEVRVEDPIFAGSPDQSAGGLLTAFGAVDGIGSAPLGPPPTTAVFDLPDFFVPPPAPGGLVGDLYVCGVFLPGATSLDTAIGVDRTAPTVLGDSSTTVGGALPALPNNGANYMMRLLLDGDRMTLSSGTPAPAEESRGANFRVGDEYIALDRESRGVK